VKGLSGNREYEYERSETWEGGYVGIPYSDRGRDRHGCDCWGLVRLVYRERLEIILPSYRESYEASNDPVSASGAIAKYKGTFTEVQQPRPGDVVLLRVIGNETHVGIYLEGRRMLHAMKGTNSCIVNLRSKAWTRRVAGYFRHGLVTKEI
jgi:cell wall-associated NlpC family hydrolase